MEPREGERLRVATDDYAAAVLTTWAAPFTGGGDERPIPRGTVLVVQASVEGRPSFVAVPEDYQGLERLLVDASDRKQRRYDGYYLVVPKADVGTALERL
jgi:hypothetical protein